MSFLAPTVKPDNPTKPSETKAPVVKPTKKKRVRKLLLRGLLRIRKHLRFQVRRLKNSKRFLSK